MVNTAKGRTRSQWDYLSGIAEWVTKRIPTLSEMLHWVKLRAAHRTTYSRILGRVIQLAELERVGHDYFANQD